MSRHDSDRDAARDAHSAAHSGSDSRSGSAAGAEQPPPEPDDPRKPHGLTDLSRRSWWGVVKRSVGEFRDDNCTDWAAALTYYAVLAMFPALIAMTSIVGLVGDPKSTTDALLDIVDRLGPASAVNTFEGPIQQIATNQRAGLALILGLALSLWSASGYVGAFSRAMNAIYEVQEGRPFYKLRPVQLLITLACVILLALVALALVVTGPLARAVGDAVGLGNAAVMTWDIAKWPVLAIIVSLLFSLLYYATPNVRQPRFRWITIGGVLALVVWLLASGAFALYVANFSSYNKTYGTLAAVVVFLIWLWLSNVAILFGAEVNAELERARELEAGIPEADDTIQLPPRNAKKVKSATTSGD